MQDPARKISPEQRSQEARARAAIRQAQITGKTTSYVDDDGCEITVTPSGHVFYNVSDWY